MRVAPITTLRPQTSFLLRAAAIALAGYAVTLHALMAWFIPDPLFYSDSPTYFMGAIQSLSGGTFSVPIHRTFGYPVFLLAVLKVFQSFHAVVIVQHAVAIGSATLCGLICHRFLGGSRIAGVMCGALFAAMPTTLASSQAILTETLYTFLLLTTLYVYLQAVQDGRTSSWAAAGLCGAVQLWVRPSGWSTAFAMGLCSMPLVLRSGLRRPVLVSLLIFGVAIFGSSALMARKKGAPALERFSRFSMLWTTAPWLIPEDAEDPTVRAVLTEMFAIPGIQEKLKQEGWAIYDPDGPVARLSRIMPDTARRDAALKQVSLHTLRRRPFAVAFDQIKRLYVIFSGRHAVPSIYLDYSMNFFLHRGMQLYGNSTRDYPEAASLVKENEERALTHLNEIAQLSTLADMQASELYTRLQKEDPYPYWIITKCSMPLYPLIATYAGLPVLGLLAGIYLLGSRKVRGSAAIILLTLFAHYTVSNLAGDSDRRHLFPVEPLLWALVGAALSFLDFHSKSRPGHEFVSTRT